MTRDSGMATIGSPVPVEGHESRCAVTSSSLPKRFHRRARGALTGHGETMGRWRWLPAGVRHHVRELLGRQRGYGDTAQGELSACCWGRTSSGTEGLHPARVRAMTGTPARRNALRRRPDQWLESRVSRHEDVLLSLIGHFNPAINSPELLEHRRRTGAEMAARRCDELRRSGYP
jgi:hypothetical protein